MALGATRWRVVRQLLLESVVLGFIGGSLGLLLPAVGVRMINGSRMQAALPYWIVFRLDYIVFAYVAAVCVVTAILCGLAPALYMSNANNHAVLKDSTPSPHAPSGDEPMKSACGWRWVLCSTTPLTRRSRSWRPRSF